jgi:RNA polymerase sigma factor (sigma-70 family)
MAFPAGINFYQFTSSYLEALRKGDSETELHFLAYFTPLVQCRVRKLLRSPEQVQDATQETFARLIRIVRSPKGIHHPERFGGFVLALCTNVAREIRRQEKKFTTVDELSLNPSPIFGTFAQNLSAAEARIVVTQILGRMSSFDRRLLKAVYLDEEDKPQLCRRFGVTTTHLHVLVHRAKRRFLNHLPELRAGKATRRPERFSRGPARSHYFAA